METKDSRESGSVRIERIAIPLIAICAPFIGGAQGLWVYAALFAAAGSLLLVVPPCRSLGHLANVICLLFLLLAASAWLPAHWLPLPSWRGFIEGNLGAVVSQTRSPQPWLTVEATCLLVANIAWGYSLFARVWTPSTRLFMMRVFGIGIVAISAVALAGYYYKYKVPFWPRVLNSQTDFGFFANRNQTANVLSLSGIVIAALAYQELRNGRVRAVFWIGGLMVICGSLVIAYSRAGILIFFIGTGFWAVASAWFSRSSKYLAIMLSAMIVLLAAFFMFGGATLKRFQFPVGARYPDFRIPIQIDAFHLAAQAPWLGAGMGNFEALFRLFRKESRQQDYALHPDSDWLWLAVDLGWLSVMALAVGLGLWIKRCFPFESRERAPLRLAAVTYGIGFALAGFIDVSGHRIGTLWPALFVMSLALSSSQAGRKVRWVTPVFRVAGLSLILIAAVWLSPLFGWNGWPTSDTLAQYQAEADSDSVDYDHLLEVTTAGLQIAPLEWSLYARRGMSQAYLGDQQAAIRDFRVSRFLQPYFVDSSYEEGGMWLELDEPAYALEAWRETLRRAPDGGFECFQGMFTAAASHPAIRNELRAWAIGEPTYQLALMSVVSGDEFRMELDLLLAADPDLTRLSPEKRSLLFQLWVQKGDPEALVQTLLSHPQWQKDQWRFLSQYYASANNYQLAYETARRFAGKPALPTLRLDGTRSDLEREASLHPEDLSIGLALYVAQMRDGSIDEAHATLRRLKQGEGRPRYLSFMEAELFAGRGAWKEAWTAWEEFIAAGG